MSRSDLEVTTMNSKVPRYYLTGMSVVSGLGVSIGALPAMLALLFKPGSEATLFWRAEHFCVVIFPVVCVIGLIGSWALYHRNYARFACLVASLPILNVLVFAASVLQIR